MPWADTCLDLRARLDSKGLVGEYLRVFRNRQLARYASDHRQSYASVKAGAAGADPAGFTAYCNARAFRANLLALGVAVATGTGTDEGGAKLPTVTTGTGAGGAGKHGAKSGGALSVGQLDSILQYYVDLATLDP